VKTQGFGKGVRKAPRKTEQDVVNKAPDSGSDKKTYRPIQTGYNEKPSHKTAKWESGGGVIRRQTFLRRTTQESLFGMLTKTVDELWPQKKITAEKTYQRNRGPGARNRESRKATAWGQMRAAECPVMGRYQRMVHPGKRTARNRTKEKRDNFRDQKKTGRCAGRREAY